MNKNCSGNSPLKKKEKKQKTFDKKREDLNNIRDRAQIRDQTLAILLHGELAETSRRVGKKVANIKTGYLAGKGEKSGQNDKRINVKNVQK